MFPEVGSLGHKGVPFLISWGNYILFSTVAAPICIPTIGYEGSLFSTSHQHLFVDLLMIAILTGVRLYLIVVLIYISLMMLNIFPYVYWPSVCPLLKIFYLFIFGERGREGKRDGGKHQCVVASHIPTTGDQAHSPCICPDWESNRWPFCSQAGAQSTESH